MLLNITPYHKIWSYAAYGSEFSCGLLTLPQSSLCQREVNYVQGFGATCNINAMIFSLGSREVYDRLWPKQWNSFVIGRYMNDVLRYFRPTLMHTSGAMSKLLSGHGMERYRPNEFWYCDEHDVDAGVNYNYGCPPVAYLASVTTDRHHNDRRLHIADSLQSYHDSNLLPRGKLTIMSSIHVIRIVFNENNAAVSVLIRGRGASQLKTVSPSSGGEIIVCAGVFESPRILISSGLKDSSLQVNDDIVQQPATDTTAALGGSPIDKGNEDSDGIKLPYLAAIGENFQDHVILPYILLGNWYSNWSISHHPGSSYKGVGRYPFNSVHGWIDLDDHGNPCDGVSTIPR